MRALRGFEKTGSCEKGVSGGGDALLSGRMNLTDFDFMARSRHGAELIEGGQLQALDDDAALGFFVGEAVALDACFLFACII